MKTNINLLVIALLCCLILISAAEAARVAIVVDLANQTYTKCVTVSDNADAYKVIQQVNLNISWSPYGGALGHGLCGINEIGCPSENCYCDASKYWGFYVKEKTGENWSYSQTGFDGGTSCSEHYCAQDGDMIGLAYGEYGTKPKEYMFNEICLQEEPTTITTSTSSTTTEPSKSPVIGEVTGAQTGNNPTALILGVLIIAAAVGFTGYKTYKKRKH
jgi:hypothetical protein